MIAFEVKQALVRPLGRVLDHVTGAVRSHDPGRPLADLVEEASRTRPFVRELPAVTASGNLPQGIHDVDLGSFLARHAGTPYRAELLRPFAERVLHLQKEGAREVIVAGSAVSTKPRPGDVDVLVRRADRRLLRPLDRAADWAHGVRWHVAEQPHATLDPLWDGRRPTWLDYFQRDRAMGERGVARIVLSPGAR